MTRHLPHVQRQFPCLYNCIFSFSFGAFISADTLSWAHKHSCIQTTWILPKEKISVWCVSNSCGLLSLHLSLTSLWLLHCKHLDEPLPWYSSHQCSVANLSFFLHELCDFSTWSYHSWLHLNPRFTQIPLYYPAIHTGDLPRCAYSMPLLLARVSVLQWVCFAIERV